MNKMPKLLAILVRLVICKFAFDAFIGTVQAEHSVRRQLNYSESPFDQLNNAIYNQLLNAELSPAVANEFKTGEPSFAAFNGEAKDEPENGRESSGRTVREKPDEQINYPIKTELADLNGELDDGIQQQRLPEYSKLSADPIDGHSRAPSADSSSQNGQLSSPHSSSPHSSNQHSSPLMATQSLDDQPSALQSNSGPPESGPDNSNRSLLDLLEAQTIGKQIDKQAGHSSVHWLMEVINSSSPPGHPNMTKVRLADHAASDTLTPGTASANPSASRPQNLNGLTGRPSAPSPLAKNQTPKSRSTRSSNNPKMGELVRRVNCEANKDCIHSNVCDSSQGMCKCPKGYINVNDMKNQKDIEPVNWPPTHCYAAQQLEKSCIYDEQCIVKHSKCTRDESLGSQLICACTLGYASKGWWLFAFVLFGSFESKVLMCSMCVSQFIVEVFRNPLKSVEIC